MVGRGWSWLVVVGLTTGEVGGGGACCRCAFQLSHATNVEKPSLLLRSALSR